MNKPKRYICLEKAERKLRNRSIPYYAPVVRTESSMDERNSIVPVEFSKMEESRNATSPSEAVRSTANANSLSSEPLHFESASSHVDVFSNSLNRLKEAVTSTTNANSLSSEPQNFGPAPSHVDVVSNNPVRLKGFLYKLSKEDRNTIIRDLTEDHVMKFWVMQKRFLPNISQGSRCEIMRIVAKEYIKKLLDIQATVKDNSGFNLSLPLQNSPITFKFGNYVCTATSTATTSTFKSGVSVTESQTTTTNSGFKFGTSNANIFASPAVSESVSKVSHSLPSTAQSSATTGFEMLESASVTLATTTTTASFGFSSSGSTFGTVTNPKITEVTSTTANSNPVTIKMEEIKTASTTTAVTTSTPSAFSFFPTSSAPSSSAAATTTASATTTSEFGFGASSNQSGGSLTKISQAQRTEISNLAKQVFNKLVDMQRSFLKKLSQEARLEVMSIVAKEYVSKIVDILRSIHNNCSPGSGQYFFDREEIINIARKEIAPLTLKDVADRSYDKNTVLADMQRWWDEKIKDGESMLHNIAKDCAATSGKSANITLPGEVLETVPPDLSRPEDWASFESTVMECIHSDEQLAFMPRDLLTNDFQAELNENDNPM